MNVTIQIATMSKTDVCHAAIAEIADYVNRVVLKMPFQELIKKTADLNMYQTRINVSDAEFAQVYALAVYGKWKKIYNNQVFLFGLRIL